MERGIKKRRRARELAIVERIRQNIPLNDDEMNYMINFFDLESLNQLCTTSWTMQEFCKSNQVWKQKFKKLIPIFDRYHTLFAITRNEWIEYWDVLSKDFQNGYRLLVAFLTTWEFPDTGDPQDMRIIDDAKNNGNLFSFNSQLGIGKWAKFSVPIIYDMRLRLFILGYFRFRFDNDNWMYRDTLIRCKKVVESLGWKIEFIDLNKDLEAGVPLWKILPTENALHDMVPIVYLLLGARYLHNGTDFKKITTQIGCDYCASPNPQTICGKCEQVTYCNQQCADSHWETHNCK
jgi:hypothetical protein